MSNLIKNNFFYFIYIYIGADHLEKTMLLQYQDEVSNKINDY